MDLRKRTENPADGKTWKGKYQPATNATEQPMSSNQQASSSASHAKIELDSSSIGNSYWLCRVVLLRFIALIYSE